MVDRIGRIRSDCFELMIEYSAQSLLLVICLELIGMTVSSLIMTEATQATFKELRGIALNRYPRQRF